MIKAVLFDFFDVIHSDHQKAWLAANGFKREGGFAEASDQLDRGEIDFDHYLERYGSLSSKKADVVRKEFEAFDAIDQAVVQIIDSLHRNYRTGLVSNAHSDELRPILNRYDLVRLFDEIHISSELGMAKPDPEIFAYALNSLQVAADEGIFIDDNPVNIAAAKQVGLQGIVFTDASALLTQLQHLDVTV